MKISDYVRLSIDAYERGELELALLLATNAVDGTARKTMGAKAPVGKRFVALIEDHLWIAEPMFAAGVNLETTDFAWSGDPRRFPDIVYEAFRCNLAHGAPLPEGYGVILRASDDYRHWTATKDGVELPDTLIFALLAIVVFAAANRDEHMGTGHFLSHKGQVFPIDEWWGREEDVRPYFAEVLSAATRISMVFRSPDSTV